MKTTANINNLNVSNTDNNSNRREAESEEVIYKEKMESLVETLRNIAKDEFITNKEVAIPSECEKYGFVQGDHNLAQMLQFLADMLEE
jgi:hypothetical protein